MGRYLAGLLGAASPSLIAPEMTTDNIPQPLPPSMAVVRIAGACWPSRPADALPARCGHTPGLNLHPGPLLRAAANLSGTLNRKMRWLGIRFLSLHPSRSM